MDVFSFFVDDIDAGKRVDFFLSQEMDFVSRSRVKTLIEKGFVKNNDLYVTKPSYLVKKGDIFQVFVEEPISLISLPQDIPLEIVYEDSDIVVINKARGMVVHPAAGNADGTIVNALLYHIKDLSSINGVIRPGIVHRLDKNTTGLMVVAKNNESHLSLASQFANRTVEKIYMALVDGIVPENEGIIEKPIGRNPWDRKKMAIISTGRYAKTGYSVIERFKNFSYIKFSLFTGRTHQIRVHSKYINHPIVGDILYGGSNLFDVSGQLLHAYSLQFNHPKTNKLVSFYKEIPDDFLEVLNMLKKEVV